MFHTNILILFIIISQCGANFLPEAVQSPDIFQTEEEDSQGAGSSTSHKKFSSTTAKTLNKTKKRLEDISLDFSEFPDEESDIKEAKDEDVEKGVIDLDFAEIPDDYDDYDEDTESSTKVSKTTAKHSEDNQEASELNHAKGKPVQSPPKFKDISVDNEEAEEFFSVDGTNYSCDYDLELIKRELLNDSIPESETSEAPETTTTRSTIEPESSTSTIKFVQCSRKKNRIETEDKSAVTENNNLSFVDSQLVDKLMLNLYEIIPV